MFLPRVGYNINNHAAEGYIAHNISVYIYAATVYRSVLCVGVVREASLQNTDSWIKTQVRWSDSPENTETKPRFVVCSKLTHK